MTRGPAAIAALVLMTASVTVLTMPALAQEARPPVPPGPSYVQAPDGWNISAGETLEIGPGSIISGDGAINVFGSLTVKGLPDSTTNFSVPIFVYPGGRVQMEHAHLWGVDGTALHLTGGTAVLTDVLLDANSRAIFVDGDSTLTARNATFRDHAGEAVYVEERAVVTLESSTFEGNGRGITLYSAARFALNDSLFAGNNQHLVVDLGPWSAPGEMTLARNVFRAPAATPAQLPSILLRHDPPLVEETEQRTVRLVSNRIEGAPVGLRAEGRGLVVLSQNDTIVDNAIGLSVQLATIRVEGGTFGNDRDVDGSGRVTLDGVTYLRSGALDVDGAAGVSPWLPWALGSAVVLVGAAALLVPRLARTRAPPEPIAIVPSVPALRAPPAAPASDLATPLTSVERRILEDILAHRGTPQRAVADRMGMTRQALHYHIKKLEARGLVQKTVEGRETRCEIPAAVGSLLAALSATRTESQEKA